MRSSAPGASRRTTARMARCLAVLLAGATLFGVSACTTSPQSDELTAEPATVQTDYGEMPDVVGMKPQEAWEALVQMPHVTLRSQTEAETLLASSGLENVTIVEQGEVDPGLNHVVEALPEEGSWVSPHSTVTLTVSSDVTVPDLIGDDPVSAAGALTVLGLVPSPAVPSYSVQGDEPMPQVVGMSVEPGEVVRMGATVELEFDRPL